MDKLYGILNMALPVAAMLGAGILCRKTGLISPQGIADIKAFIINICLPAALLSTFMSMEFSVREGVMMLVMTAAMLLAFGGGFLVCRLLGLKRKVSPFLCCTIEGGGIGFPLYTLLFGQKNLYHFALLDVGGSLIQWPLIMTLFAMLGKGKQSLRDTLKALATPVNFAILAGVALSISGVGGRILSTPFGGVLENTLDFISAPTSAVMIMTVGYGLVFKDVSFKEIFKGMGARAIVSAAVCIIVVLATMRIFPKDHLYLSAVILYYTMPPTYVYSSMSSGGEDESYIGSYLPLYTLATIVCFVILSGILV